MTTHKLIEWLRENSSGVYRPSSEAADLLERYHAALVAISNWSGGVGVKWPHEIASDVLADSQGYAEEV